ncbi:MAG TPA: chemotaxis protein CheD [Opitutaceae bacterium]|nr:chemotaxis protein CheD [Opitutaceae bacterium]
MPPDLETPPPELIVSIGDLKESKNPQGVIVTYALGSCLGITCYDPFGRMGGMLHAMLPDSKAGHQSALARAAYLDTGIADLIQRVTELGGNPRVFQFKVFGGAQTIQASNYFNIGAKNITMMEALATQLRLQVKVWEVGGPRNRTIRFYLRDGGVKLHMPSQPDLYL